MWNNNVETLEVVLGHTATCAYLRLRVSGRRFSTKRARIWVKIGLGSVDNNASSKLGKEVSNSDRVVNDTEPEQTHSIGESRPSIFPLSFVNLHMKA